MNTNHLIRASIAFGLLAAVGCADGQRSSGDRAGKGKVMRKALDPSTNLVNGKPSKTAATAADAQGESMLAAAETDLTTGTALSEFPAGSFRLVGSVTIYKLQETNENVKAGVYVTYGNDANFTADVRDTTSIGKFGSSVDQGLNLILPLTLISADRSVVPGVAKLMLTQVKSSANKIEIVETRRDLPTAAEGLQGIIVDKAIVNGRDQSSDGKIVANVKLLKLKNDTDVRVILMVEEAPAPGMINKVIRNVYLTYHRTGDAPAPADPSQTPGSREADATPEQERRQSAANTVDESAAAGTKTN